MNMKIWPFGVSAIIAALVVSAPSVAEPDAGSHGAAGHPPSSNLASQATNPGAALIQLQLQNAFAPNSHSSSGVGNNFIIQPVIPFKLPSGLYFENLINRSTLPIVTTPDPNGPIGRTTGLGDLTSLFVPVAKHKLSDTVGFEWGPIGAVTVPTATDNRTGSGKLSLGPGLLAIAGFKNIFGEGGSMQIGAYGYNTLSVLGEGSRSDVNKLFVGPALVYHFGELFGQKGWYTGWTDELMSYDWTTKTASIPVGGRLGKVFNIGKQPVNAFVQSDYYVAHRGTDPVWDIKFNLTFLFPE